MSSSMGRNFADPAQKEEVQRAVDAYFDAESSFWDEIYAGNEVYAVIHKHRHALALELIGQLGLPGGSRVLEVGCGAGLMTVALAERGFQIDATDTAPAMIDGARQNVRAAGASSQVTVSGADAHSLSFEDEVFDLVVALGVIPWLHSPNRALGELARVLRPGGYLIANVDNRWRLHYLLDPIFSPVFAPARRVVKWVLQRLGLRRQPASIPPNNLHSRGEFDRLISSLDLEKMGGSMYGFGPFTLFARRVLPKRLGVFVHRKLQRACDRGTPGLRSAGAQYLVLARKPSDAGSA
jgi:ubiquinone/menaquinone biosynthesis C-methylase UbiE